MSRRLHGIPAARGRATAPVWRYEPATIPTAAGERSFADLDAAAGAAASELETLASALREGGQPEEGAIYDAQALIARDPELLAAARRHVGAGVAPAEAVIRAAEEVATALDRLDTEVSGRSADVRDVAQRIARVAGGASPHEVPRTRCVVVARELPPSMIGELGRSVVAGIATERGTPTAHLAILARGLGIPAVVGVGGLVDAAGDAKRVSVDGDAGVVVIDPEPDDESSAATAEGAAHADVVERPAGRGLRTRDGHAVRLSANIGLPSEAAVAFAAGAEGIGLFRTEFLVGGSRTPDEDDQTAAYRAVLDAANDRPVAFRLLRSPGDGDTSAEREATGTQLRALLRAASAASTTLRLLAPMIADVLAVEALRGLVERTAAELAASAVPAPLRVEVGVMVELPSAVLLADQLAGRADFLAVGTNDLTQYLVGADRDRPEHAHLQDAVHPAVLRAVACVVAGAAARAVPVSVCGEIAGDPVGAVLMVGLGVDELSMVPAAFGPVRAAVGAVSRDEAAALALRCADLRSVAEVRAAVSDLVGR